jgi:glutathione S-transferase
MLGTMGGAAPLDAPGTDFAIRYVRGAWKYHGITAERLADDLAGLPAKLDHIDGLVADGIVDGEEPTAADLQIGATLRVLMCVGDVRPMIEGRPAERVARWFRESSFVVPAGAFPAAWV